MPSHTHAIGVSTSPGTTNVASGSTAVGAPPSNAFGAAYNLAPMAANAGGSEPHNNLQPYLALNFCIALQGIFPARS